MSDPEQPRKDEGPRPEAEADAEGDSAGDGQPESSWRHLHLWEIQPVRDVLVIVALLALLWFGYHLRLVTIPLLLAMALAYLFEPLVKRLVNIRRVNRHMAAGGIIVAAAVLIVAPLTLGAGFATVQGVTYARTLSDNIDLVVDYVENPDDEALKARLEDNSALLFLAEWLISQEQRERERQARLAEDIRQRTKAADNDEPNGGSGQESGTPDAGEPESAGQPPGNRDQPPAGAPPEQGEAEDARPRRSPRSVREAAGEAVASSVEERTAVGEFAGFLLRWIQTNADAIASRALRTGQGALSAAISGLARVGMLLFMGFLTAFFFFFISTSWGRVVEFWEGLIPERRKGRVIELAGKMDEVISGFVRGRVIIAFILAIFFTLAYWLVGMPMPLILGPAVGVISLVPYVSLISLPITIGAMLVDPQPIFAFQTATWWAIVAPIAIYQIGQISDDYLLTPMIQGRTTDMDTPTILFASIAGGVLAGIYGLLLAIPVAACIKILLREVFWPQFREWAEGQRADFLPIGRK